MAGQRKRTRYTFPADCATAARGARTRLTVRTTASRISRMVQQFIFHHFALLFRDSSVVKRAGPLIIEPVRLAVLKTVQQCAMLCFLA